MSLGAQAIAGSGMGISERRMAGCYSPGSLGVGVESELKVTSQVDRGDAIIIIITPNHDLLDDNACDVGWMLPGEVHARHVSGTYIIRLRRWERAGITSALFLPLPTLRLGAFTASQCHVGDRGVTSL